MKPSTDIHLTQENVKVARVKQYPLIEKKATDIHLTQKKAKVVRVKQNPLIEKKQDGLEEQDDDLQGGDATDTNVHISYLGARLSVQYIILSETGNVP